MAAHQEDNELSPQRRLVDIKKKLGLQREDIYGVFKYNKTGVRRVQSAFYISDNSSSSNNINKNMSTTDSSSPRQPGGGARRRPPPPKPQPYKSSMSVPQDTSLPKTQETLQKAPPDIPIKSQPPKVQKVLSKVQEISPKTQETLSKVQEISPRTQGTPLKTQSILPRAQETTPPREEGLVASQPSGSISPSVLARIDHRPRMDSPILDRSLSPSLPRSSSPSFVPSSSPQLSSKHALRFSPPPPLPPPYHLDEEEERAMVVSQAPPLSSAARGNYNYSEVTIKTLVPIKSPEHTHTPPTQSCTDDDAYDVTSHIASTITRPITDDDDDHKYSSLATPPQRVYDSIDFEDDKDTHNKPHSSLPLRKPPYQQRSRSSSPKPPLAPKPVLALSPKLSSKQPPPKPPRPSCSEDSPSPMGQRKPAVLPKPNGRGSPSPSSPLVVTGNKAFSFDDDDENVIEKKEESGSKRDIEELHVQGKEKEVHVGESGRVKLFEKEKIDKCKEELQEKENESVKKNEVGRVKVFEKEKDKSNNDLRNINKSSEEISHVCEVDIDALVSRKNQEFEQLSQTPPTQKTRPRQQHIYDDVNELLNKPSESPRLNNTKCLVQSRSVDHEGKRPKEPPKRRPPPPPVAKGSPPIQRKPNPPGTDSKSLTLGRTPRSNIELSSPPNEPKLPVKKVTSIVPGNSPSPGIKSKFKNFFASGSRDDSYTGRRSFKKRKGSQHVITGPVEGSEEGGRSSKTLPGRPRGKSVDPYMDSAVPSTYSIITMGAEEDDEGDDDAFSGPSPYTVVDIDSIKLRKNRGNNSSELRKSRSVEHLYDMAHFGGADRKKRSPSPLIAKSPSIPDLIDDDLSSHIYSYINKPKKQVAAKNKEQEEKESIIEASPIRDKSPKPISPPPPPIPPFNPTTHVYAKISKTDTTTNTEEPPTIITRPPPPVPRPYCPPTHNTSTNNDLTETTPTDSSPPIVVTQSGTKYKHLLKKTLPPPSHNPPPPPPSLVTPSTHSTGPTSDNTPSIDIKRTRHDYEMIDFDNPSYSSSSSPSSSLTTTTNNNNDNNMMPSQQFISPVVVKGKRELKPKDRPAPPPPFKKKESFDTPKSHTLEVSPTKRGGNLSLDSSGFLFGDKRASSFVELGTSPNIITPMSPSTSSSTLRDTAYDDSDFSSDFDPSSEDEDNEKKEDKTPKSKTYYIAQEILTTEKTFVRGLGLLHIDFRQHMISANNAHDKPVVTDEVLSQILSNIGNLHMLNSELLKELNERMAVWDSNPRLGDIFVRRAPFLKLYSQYISNFDAALKTLDEQQKKNPIFAQVVKEFELEPKCSRLTVAAYLLETVQRIPRYKLLLADYIKHLEPDSIDREDSEKALKIISEVATHVNETIRQMDNFRKTVEVSKRLIGDVGESLLSPHRKLLKEGELVKSSRKEKQPRMFFLFSDLLIYASAIPPANTTFRVIKRIPLDGMKVQLLDDPELKNGFQIVSTCKSFRLDASSTEDKQQWLQAFETAIKDHAQRVKSRQINRRSMIVDQNDEMDGGGELGALAPPWLPDSSVSMCQLCGIHFTVTRRRHHCRACGMIFCGECSSYATPLPYNNNKMSRVCQTCYTTLNEGGDEVSPEIRTMGSKRRSLKMSQKKISMPSVLREVRARDESAHISGYLYCREDKSRQWKRKWFVVYDLVMYEFKRHEDVSAQRSIPLPSYTVVNPVEGMNDNLVFSLQHSGAGRLLFKTEDSDQLDSWLDILYKAVKGEIHS